MGSELLQWSCLGLQWGSEARQALGLFKVCQ